MEDLAVNLGQMAAKVRAAQVLTFRSQYRVDANHPIALSDSDTAMVFHVSGPDKGGTRIIDKRQEGEGERLKTMIPAGLHAHYDKLRADERFDRFLLCAKSHGNGTTDDAMIVAFGKDELYYVVAVWDENGYDVWEPLPGGIDAPLIKYD